MESESIVDKPQECKAEAESNSSERLNDNSLDTDEVDCDNSIHAFNISCNTTCIEKVNESSPEADTNVNKHASCEGSDSGVEVIESCTFQRTLSTNSTNYQFETDTPARSCDSSIISCCSNYEEAYNLLARRNSTLLEDYKLRNSDGTSEGGSESSSVVSSRNSKRTTTSGVKKKVALNDTKAKTSIVPTRRNKTPTTPKNTNTPLRGKSTDRLPPKTPTNKTPSNKTPSKSRAVPDNLPLSFNKKETKKTASRGSSSTRTPTGTPSDDGRWPSVNSKPAPLLAKTPRAETPIKSRLSHVVDNKNNTLEKYATLPRRRKEKSADNINDVKRTLSRENSANRSSTLRRQITPQKTLPPYPRKKAIPKTKIYHEISIQTALTNSDIEKALSGVAVNPSHPQDTEKCDKEIQADRSYEELEKVKEQHNKLNELYEKLKTEHEETRKKLLDTEERLNGEIIEKNGLKEELRQNTERVLAILGGDENISKEGIKIT